MNVRSLATSELIEELRRRKDEPTWFIRGLVADGVDIDNDDFRAATDWMDEPRGMEE